MSFVHRQSVTRVSLALMMVGLVLGGPGAVHAAGPTTNWHVTAAPGGGQSASFTVSFSSANSGQGEVLFGPGPGCQSLIETATQDRGAGTTQHIVVVTGNDLAGTAGDNGIVPGTTYSYEVLTTGRAGTEADSNSGKCYTITIPGARYRVTLTNSTYGQGFSFPVAATHAPSVHLFQLGKPATAAAAAVAQNGNPIPLFTALRATVGVTDLYVDPFPVASSGNPTAFWKRGLPFFNGATLAPTTSDHTLQNTISFDISASPHDVFSVLGMLMCTTDGLTGLDGVALPQDRAHPVTYSLASYDAGVEANTYYTPDIVDPCALMAPYTNGAPTLSVTDGNRNSPPTPSQGASTTFTTEPDLNIPLAQSDPITGLSGTIPDNSGKPHPERYVPASWGWNGPVGSVTISKIGG